MWIYNEYVLCTVCRLIFVVVVVWILFYKKRKRACTCVRTHSLFLVVCWGFRLGLALLLSFFCCVLDRTGLFDGTDAARMSVCCWLTESEDERSRSVFLCWFSDCCMRRVLACGGRGYRRFHLSCLVADAGGALTKNNMWIRTIGMIGMPPYSSADGP